MVGRVALGAAHRPIVEADDRAVDARVVRHNGTVRSCRHSNQRAKDLVLNYSITAHPGRGESRLLAKAQA